MGNTQLNLPLITLQFLVHFVLVVGLANDVWSKEQNLIVAVEETAPCVMHSDSGYTGFDIELWEAIARDLDWEFTYHETDLKGILYRYFTQKSLLPIGSMHSGYNRKALCLRRIETKDEYLCHK